MSVGFDVGSILQRSCHDIHQCQTSLLEEQHALDGAEHLEERVLVEVDETECESLGAASSRARTRTHRNHEPMAEMHAE